MNKINFNLDSLRIRVADFEPKQKNLSITADGENGSPNSIGLPN